MRVAAFLACMLAATSALAQISSSAPPADLSGYATTDALSAAMSSAAAAASTKLDAVPAAGPGAGKCKQSIVPSDMVTSGGVAGTAGTCSRILQCGTSAAYVVTQFNVGSGC